MSVQSGRGALTGVVKDASDAVVPGVEIKATNKATGVEEATVSTDAGVYRFPYVHPGTYQLMARLPGFKSAIADNIEVLVAQVVTDMNFEIHMDVINLLNRFPLGNPNTNAGDPARFGRITGKFGGPRVIQLGLRLNY